MRACTDGVIRVASVPENHPYVRHLSAANGGSDVSRLSDPPPAVAHPSEGQWWPPRMLDLDWLDRHHHEIQVMHIHFGFDEVGPGDLRKLVDRLDVLSIPLVLTVHDLVNPHFTDPQRHLEQLGVLVPAAAEVITLTVAAATEIERRWARRAVVIPHPHMVPLGVVGRPHPVRPNFVIGLHAKSLRANMDPLPLLRALVDVLPCLPDARLRLDVHPDVLDPAHGEPRAAALRSFLDTVRGHAQFELAVHPRFSDDELWDYLQSIDLCVLPYRFGTHSGWLEACVDLGTGVLVPATGCYGSQHGHPTYTLQEGNLAGAVRAIHADPSLARPERPDRVRQRQQIAAEHRRIYRRVIHDRAAALDSGQAAS